MKPNEILVCLAMLSPFFAFCFFGLWLVLTERGYRWGVRHFGNAEERKELEELERREATARQTDQAEETSQDRPTGTIRIRIQFRS